MPKIQPQDTELLWFENKITQLLVLQSLCAIG